MSSPSRVCRGGCGVAATSRRNGACRRGSHTQERRAAPRSLMRAVRCSTTRAQARGTPRIQPWRSRARHREELNVSVRASPKVGPFPCTHLFGACCCSILDGPALYQGRRRADGRHSVSARLVSELEFLKRRVTGLRVNLFPPLVPLASRTARRAPSSLLPVYTLCRLGCRAVCCGVRLRRAAPRASSRRPSGCCLPPLRRALAPSTAPPCTARAPRI